MSSINFSNLTEKDLILVVNNLIFKLKDYSNNKTRFGDEDKIRWLRMLLHDITIDKIRDNDIIMKVLQALYENDVKTVIDKIQIEMRHEIQEDNITETNGVRSSYALSASLFIDIKN